MSEHQQLEQRDGLPEALRVLYEAFPRENWQTHENFEGLVRFWLERHVMFRNFMKTLQQDAESMLAKSIDETVYRNRLTQLGNVFITQLHGHHHVEDHHYFPELRKIDDRISRGFDILDADHHELDGMIEQFGTAANAVLKSDDSPALHDNTGRFVDLLDRFDHFLNRHLVDEEELIVPVLLKNGTERFG